jgi:hypothetical protein
MEGNTIKNLFFTLETQMLHLRFSVRSPKDSMTKLVFSAGKRGYSTIVESVRQIGVFFAKRTQSGVAYGYAGQVFSYCVKGFKFFLIRILWQILEFGRANPASHKAMPDKKTKPIYPQGNEPNYFVLRSALCVLRKKQNI